MHNKLNLIVTRPYTVLIADIYVRGLSTPEHYKTLYHLDNTHITCGYFNGEWWYGPESFELIEKLLKKETEERGFLAGVFDTIYTYGEKMVAYAKEIEKNDFTSKKDSELMAMWDNFLIMFQTFAVTLPGYGLQFPIEDRLRDFLKNRADLEEELAIISFPEKVNVQTVEKYALLEIGAQIQRGELENPSDKLDQLLQDHAQEFGWTNIRGGSGTAWDVSDVRVRLNQVLENDCEKVLHEMKEDVNIHLQRSKELLNTLHADDDIRHVVTIAKEIVYFRTCRTDYLACAYARIVPLLEEIAKRMGVTLEEISALRADELAQWKTIGLDVKSRRDDWFVLLALEPGNVQFTDRKEDEVIWRETYLHKAEEIEEIKGAVAYRGLVRGKVKKIKHKKDLLLVEAGDIIVAAMTTPDMVPAMERAAGFVTDEGGITCHAAIIAREMKKPCVIGTKVATKLLESGMYVEVDANNGCVTIL